MDTINSHRSRPRLRKCPSLKVLAGGFLKLASLDSAEESTLPAGWPGKLLILIQNSEPACRGGFQVDSPVRNPVASEIAHSAPPYTIRAREEPWEGEPALLGR